MLHIHIDIKISLSGRKLFSCDSRRKSRQSIIDFVYSIKDEHNLSTYTNYVTAVNSFTMFLGKEVSFDDLMYNKVEKFHRWLAKRNINPNTIACYMRSLRAVYNKYVVRNGLTDNHPFSHISTANKPTDKRAALQQDIIKLNKLQLPEHSPICFARDLFLFSLYAMGMPFVDLAFLRKEQVKGNYIFYNRRKTGQKVKVLIEPHMKAIIKRWTSPNGNYLFPILKSDDGTEAEKEYAAKIHSYNLMLKHVAKKAKTKAKLTSYVARHTWASLAYAQNVGLPVISKALGHTNTTTTLNYIQEINDEKIYKANRKLIGQLTNL